MLELRKKAKHYKWKSEHTHFQPHHLASLDLLRDTPSDEPSSLSSCVSSSSSQPRAPSIIRSLTPPPIPPLHPATNKDMAGRARHRPTETRSYPNNEEEPLFVRDVESDGELEDMAVWSGKKSDGKLPRMISRGNGQPPPPMLAHPQPSVEVECTCPTRTGAKLSSPPPFQGYDEIRGRIPTPELRKFTSSNECWRHHLDRTTPSGSHLLVSPPKKPPAKGINIGHVLPPKSPTLCHMKCNVPLSSESPPLPPPPLGDHPVVRNAKKEEVPIIQRRSNEATGAGGRDLPRHISGTNSPYHTRCVPCRNIPHATTEKNDTTARPMLKSASAKSHNHTNTRAGTSASTTAAVSAKAGKPTSEFVVGRPKGGLATTKYGFHSCKTCGTSLKPAVLSSSGTSQKSSNPFDRMKTTKGRDYVPPATVAARPCAHQGRSCDQGNSVHQGVRISQLKDYRPLEQVKENLASCKSEQPPVKHINCRACTKPPLKVHNRVSSTSHPDPQYKAKLYQSTRENSEEPLSVSPLSLSSCSVASDILEKARQRRDHFWTSQRQPSE